MKRLIRKILTFITKLRLKQTISQLVDEHGVAKACELIGEALVKEGWYMHRVDENTVQYSKGRSQLSLKQLENNDLQYIVKNKRSEHVTL
jgi:hypothetical protein